MRVAATLILFACLALSGTAGAGIELRVRHDDNLRYQLDCLAGLARCTTPQLPLSGALDSNELETWRSTAARRRDARPADDLPLPTAAVLSAVSSRHRSNWSGGPLDARAQVTREALLEHLLRRTAPSWRRELHPHLLRLSLELEQTARRIELDRLLPRLAALYGQDGAGLPAVSLVAIKGSADGSLATLGRHTAWVETPIGESAANRLPVIVHELVHHWQRQIPVTLRAELVDAFVASTDTCAITAYHFFDEAMASAIGNGLVERRLLDDTAFADYLALPDSFYADRRVDEIAKALLPRLERQLARDAQIDGAFVADYIALATRALGDDCASLSATMNTATFVLTDEALAPAQALAQQRLAPATAFVDLPGATRTGISGTAAARYPRLSGVVVATADTLATLRGLVPAPLLAELEAGARTHKRLVHAWPRNEWSTLYVVVGEDVPAAAAALLQLVALRPRAFSGQWLPPALPASVPD